ncbi:uncharacterized protein BP01DRAFT_46143 [Aspergillus saccharolyticus JOP 1030-1]|uniref:Uncharacterized protein n=1 Tax=Aspergillus saccharolyticus JOP 1030-1 TaxID=1450539 RepID=A0A318ZCZ6_9EURO|nr:hypothetical protein BP01DRAFT_46143 [Aspergillus saccharolyticus JOP 1030-1]PYH45215.1 hypothetical protein BP01DRAFT_46143 [Aspergillus saccharolyticus JOP 1030-1]
MELRSGEKADGGMVMETRYCTFSVPFPFPFCLLLFGTRSVETGDSKRVKEGKAH